MPRLRIVLQTAEVLAFLHSAAYTLIYHENVRSTSIVLYDEFDQELCFVTLCINNLNSRTRAFPTIQTWCQSYTQKCFMMRRIISISIRQTADNVHSHPVYMEPLIVLYGQFLMPFRIS